MSNANYDFSRILKGLFSFIPGTGRFFMRSTGGTISARYCYSVWLRHLVMAFQNKLPTRYESIAELGPGDSLGIGIAALLTAANKYYAFDVKRYATDSVNLRIFDDLVSLLRSKEPIPDKSEFPKVKPLLDCYSFPEHIITNERLNEFLNEKRLTQIRTALEHSDTINNFLRYTVPWNCESNMHEQTIDLIFSQAVMEHVEDFQRTYMTQFRWLKPGGMISHQIDFKSHGTTSSWNGHWRYGRLLWTLVKGKRPFLINRQPLSKHRLGITNSGFKIVFELPVYEESTIKRRHLARPFRDISEDDLSTSGCFIQAIKPYA
jgi:SAM-dependent methyltransferase